MHVKERKFEFHLTCLIPHASPQHLILKDAKVTNTYKHACFLADLSPQICCLQYKKNWRISFVLRAFTAGGGGGGGGGLAWEQGYMHVSIMGAAGQIHFRWSFIVPSQAHVPSPNLLDVMSGMDVHLLFCGSYLSPLLSGETPSNPPMA